MNSRAVSFVAFLAVALVALWVGPSTARAQVSTGIVPFGSYGGGPFDVVNNANLNVHLSVPILNKPGRGLPFYYYLTYDSSVWNPTGGQWAPASNWGWRGVSEALTGYVTYASKEVQCSAPPPAPSQSPMRPPGTAWYYVYSNWTYHDASGGAHFFPNVVLNTESTISNLCQITGVYSGEDTATDGTGYTLAATINTAVPATVFTATVYAVNGITINPPVGTTAGSGSITDPNGNTISTDGTHFYDTLLGTATPALTVSGTAPNPTYYAYPNDNVSGGQASVTVKYGSYTVQTNFGCGGVTDYPATQQYLVSEIDLPDIATNPTDKYTFTYETTPNYSPHVTGRLWKVTLPAGGTITYTYSGGSGGITCADGSAATLQRYTPDTGSNYWQYAHTENGNAWTTTVTDPQGNQTTYYFQGIYPTEASNSLATVYTCYDGITSSCNTTSFSFPITQVAVTTSTDGLESEVNTYYNTYGLPRETDEYAYGSGAVGGLLRKTTVTYTSGNCGTYLVDRACTVDVYNGGGTLAGQTQNTYDANGNLLKVARTVQGSTTISQSFTYNSNGTVATSTDFNGNGTSYSYNGSGGCPTSGPNGLVTSIQPPLIASTKEAWDCDGGVATKITDANSQPTTYGYDSMWRTSSTTPPATATTTISYSPTQIESSLINSNGLTTNNYSNLDGLGRVKQTELTGTSLSNPTYVTTTFDSLGRTATVTNPYQTTSDPTYGYDTYGYDVLSRVTSVTHSGDSNEVQSFYGSAVASNGGRSTQMCSSSTYGLGYPSLSMDETGKKRQMWTDALGHLIEVDEPDPANGSLTDSNAVNTCYTYNTLNGLTEVDEGSQKRQYGYDMLGRLTSASTPESGTTNYYYTNSGGAVCSGNPSAVCRRTDARSITTTYSYDALNRLTSKSYSDGTPTANFVYDESSVNNDGVYYTVTNGLGRLTHTWVIYPSGNFFVTIHSYDAAGRVQDYWQCTPYNCLTTSIWNSHYTYDSAGNISSWTHPAGFTITNTYNAAMQTTQITSSLNDSQHPPSLATLTYAPSGALATLVNGCAGSGCTQVQETYDYNKRLQPVRIQLGTSLSNAADYCLVYNYYAGVGNPATCTNTPGTATSGNNGNVMGYWYQDNINPTTMSHAATYGYDSLNRLTSAVATGNATYNQSFSLDRYGNMQCSGCGYTFTNNRINQYSYDAAGDLTGDGTHTYQWDGEGKLKSVDNGATFNFGYNALGQQVQDTVSQWNHLYDAAGKFSGRYGTTGWLGQNVRLGDRLLATYSEYAPGGTYFTHPNALGSVGVNTNQAGSEYQDLLYYPWGQVWTNVGMMVWSYAGFEYRNASTVSLDPTLNRTYSYAMGRWLSPDPLAGDISNPQSLNRYAYALNNPTTLTDPSGACTQGQPNCPPNGIAPTCYSFSCAEEYYPESVATFLESTGPNWDPFDIQAVAFTPTALAVYTVVNSEGGLQWNPDDPNFGNEFGAFWVYGNISALDLLGLLGPNAPSSTTTVGTMPVTVRTTTRCSGGTRALAGNPNLIGRQGGVPGTTVTSGSTAAIPSQWGGITPLALLGDQVFGIVAVPSLGGVVAFKGVTDTVGSSTVPNVQQYLQNRFPGNLILELNNLPAKNDSGQSTFTALSVPQPMGCPAGTNAF